MNSADAHVIFLYMSTLSNVVAETKHNINQAFESTVNEREVQHCFEKFRFGDLSLQKEQHERPKWFVNDVSKSWMKMNSNGTTNELFVRMKVDHSTILQHLSAIKEGQKN